MAKQFLTGVLGLLGVLQLRREVIMENQRVGLHLICNLATQPLLTWLSLVPS